MGKACIWHVHLWCCQLPACCIFGTGSQLTWAVGNLHSALSVLVSFSACPKELLLQILHLWELSSSSVIFQGQTGQPGCSKGPLSHCHQEEQLVLVPLLFFHVQSPEPQEPGSHTPLSFHPPASHFTTCLFCLQPCPLPVCASVTPLPSAALGGSSIPLQAGHTPSYHVQRCCSAIPYRPAHRMAEGEAHLTPCAQWLSPVVRESYCVYQ